MHNGVQQTSANALGSGVSLARKVNFLIDPSAYRLDGVEVDAIETHMSWVFLAGELAFKLKKPVKLSHVDFSTLAAREADCRAELRLNKPLAPDVYVRVARLTLNASNELMIDGAGETIDWLVVMRRLPSERMLDALIAKRS